MRASDNVILKKSHDFAVRATNAAKYLRNEKHEYRISDQLYRSGTSINANILEAQYAQSLADFISKMQIALKEANESRGWVNLLHDTGYFDDRQYTSIYSDINEIVIILIAILKSSKSKT